jgi:hypothetical protein
VSVMRGENRPAPPGPGTTGLRRRGCSHRAVHTAKFGEKVVLLEPMSIELDTEILENHVR